MTNRAEFERLLDVYGFRCERFGQDLSTHARAQVVSAFAALASAPVADESPMAKMAEALREKARQEQQAYQDRRNQATEWGPMPEGTEADSPTSSAPVAHVAGDEVSRHLEWAKDRSAWEMPVGTPVYYSVLASAPVAGEAVAHAVLAYGRIQRVVVNEESAHEYAEQQRLNAEAAGWDAKAHVRPLVYGDAAPQASEAVRDALWTLTEHNALHFGEQHSTVIQGRAALSAQSAQKQGGSDA
ncbi:hypothetical protein ACOTH0_15475 [Achromobacter xylosoxidans]